jgi:hypothetical protein
MIRCVASPSRMTAVILNVVFPRSGSNADQTALGYGRQKKYAGSVSMVFVQDGWFCWWRHVVFHFCFIETVKFGFRVRGLGEGCGCNNLILFY